MTKTSYMYIFYFLFLNAFVIGDGYLFLMRIITYEVFLFVLLKYRTMCLRIILNHGKR